MENFFSHAQAFLHHLSKTEIKWLRDYAQHSTQRPPNDWIAWYGNGFFLGWITEERADQLVNWLPNCTREQRILTWLSTHQHSMQRSHDLQVFLQRQKQRGRVSGWRQEFSSFWPNTFEAPTLKISPWICIERAGFRHLGLMSHAVHINGFSPNGDMWAGLRAKDKATDPGKLDNLAAGGLSAGEDIYSTLHRELQEESGWKSSTRRLLHAAGACRSQRVESKSWHDEKIWVFNLDIPFDFSPINEDGEVEAFYLYSPHEVIERMEADQFSTDACLAICAGLGLPTRRPIS